ncbi:MULTISPECIES: DUF1353 domain-containing protein [unclassified Pseudomonas]|uniref:DUF1353 domain-containing protein n=1 Tax=unclassified Pseudomonas TaxID=196821 RepID=UPI0025DF3086|nr:MULTISPECIES: DUF1353 domain-containing protein [unclassified Pseudomonas]
MILIGKFDIHLAVRFTSRWDVATQEALTFGDPLHGPLVVPSDFYSDLASIRILREVCRWAAIGALVGWVFAWGWLAAALLVVAIVTLALYGLLAGYGMRAAILHDWLYTVGMLPRAECDAVFYRALTTGDGTARWRAAIFWLGVRLGGFTSYTKTPTRSGFFTPGEK